MKKNIIVTFIILLFVLPPLYAKNSIDITNISEDLIQLKVQIDEYEIKDVSLAGNTYQIFSLPLIKTNLLKKENSFQLPFISKVIGLPPDGSFTVDVLEQKSSIIKNIDLAYNPAEYLSKNNLNEPDYSKIPPINNSKSYFPAKIIDKEIAGFVGNRLLGVTRIYPIQYNPTTKEAKIFKIITININIKGNKKASNNNITSIIDDIADNIIINNEFSQKWRKEREKEVYNKNLYPKELNIINRFKLSILEKGIYKVTYKFLKDTISFWQDSLGTDYDFNFDVDELNPQFIDLKNKGQSIPIYFVGDEDKSFDEGDYFEFYADINHGKDCFYDSYSSENCYILVYNEGELGTRLAVEDCGLYETDPRQYRKPYYFNTTIHFEEQNTRSKLSQVTSTPEDLYFWMPIIAPSIENLTFTIHDPVQTNARAATIKVALFGETYWSANNTGNHHALAYINSALIGSEFWQGQNAEIIVGEISNDKLDDGDNNFYVSMPGDTDASYDRILLDYIDIEYWRECKAFDNYLEFNKPAFYENGLFQFEITDFDTVGIDVYKVGVSKLENVSIESSMPGGGAPYVVSFQDEIIDSSTKYIALSDDKKLTPVKTVPDIPSNIRSPINQSDYIVISEKRFLDSEEINEFAFHWNIYKNLNVKFIAIEDIFDEFNYGIRSIQSIQEFIKYAYNNWQEPVVKYVLLLGDACFDERSSSYKKEFSVVPTKFSWTYGVGATVDDNWFACIIGDDELTDIFISRIPIYEKEHVSYVFNKTFQYNNNPNYSDLWRNHCLCIAGGAGTFEEQNQRLIKNYIPNTFRVSRVYAQKSHNHPYWGGTTEIKDYIDDGTAFIQFLGHGGGQIWSDLNLMDLGDIPTLFNDNYPVISSLTCYTSNFEYAGSSCLGEAFILEPEKGAIGFFGGAGKGFLEQDEYLAEFMFNNLFQRGVCNSTAMSTLAKIEYYLNYGCGSISLTFLRGFNYLGDPAIDIVFPQDSLNVTLNSYEFVKGDTVQIKINNADTSLYQVAYYVTDEEDLITNPYNPTERQQVQYYNINRASYNPQGYEYIIDTTITSNEFSRIVRCYGYNNNIDYTGYTNFSVGKSAIFNVKTSPEIPLLGDSIYIKANVFNQFGVDSVKCIWWNNAPVEYTIIMTPDSLDDFSYITETCIDPFCMKEEINYRIWVKDNIGAINESEDMEYTIIGPDLEIQDFSYNVSKGSSYFYVELFNRGDYNSPANYLMILNDEEIIDSSYVNIIEPAKKSIINLDCNLSPGVYNLTSSIHHGNIMDYCSEPVTLFDIQVEDTIVIAARFTNEELGENLGDFIGEIAFYTPTYSHYCDITLKIYEGGSVQNPPGNLIYNASLGYFSSNRWVKHILTSPRKIKPSLEYWVVFEIHSSDGKIAWMDDGPCIQNKGAWWYIPDVGWSQISQYPQYNRNWLIQMYLYSDFLEYNYENNEITKEFDINNFQIKPDETTSHSSLDSNLVITFPAGLVEKETMFYINRYDEELEITQPDVEKIPLADNQLVNYDVAIFDSSQLNMDGTFKKNLIFKFNFSQTSEQTQGFNQDDNIKIYKYNEDVHCWFLIGGDLYLNEKYVLYSYINKPGIYSLFKNEDFTAPVIDVNVEGQEFTNGEYVDDEALFSFIIQDENGINVESIELYLNGQKVNNYSIATKDLNSIPLEYQVDVEKGAHTIILSADDANGNYKEKVVNFSVQEKFDIIHIGNYPNPVSIETSDPNNEGRTRFTYTLTNDADEVKVKIFTVSGRLVNELTDLSTTIGYHEYPRSMKGWDCVDFDNRKLANGVYFYKIIATKGDKTIEKLEKMAILR